MRCPNCKAFVPFDSRLKKCAACGAAIEKKPLLEDTLNMLAEFAEDKNFIFWGFFMVILGLIIGGLEFTLGNGQLFYYYEEHLMHSLILFMFWGIWIEHVAKSNAQIRLQSRTLILRERKLVKNFRRGTNLSLLAGLGIALVWIGPAEYFAQFPAITLITTVTVCMFWALMGLSLKDKQFEDARVRNFFMPMGVRHPHPYRVASAWYIALTIFALAVYTVLERFPSIFWGIYNTWVVQSSIKFFEEVLGYIPIL